MTYRYQNMDEIPNNQSPPSQGADNKVEWELKKPLGRLPMWSRSNPQQQLINSKRANRFLAYQEGKILKLIQEGDIRKAITIWLILLRSSRSYQLCLLTKVLPN